MNTELFTFRQRPLRFLVGVVLVVLLASWAPLALAASGSEAPNRYAAVWERYLAAQTPQALGDIGGTWAHFWDTQALEMMGAHLLPMNLGAANLAASRDAVAWEPILPWEVRGAASAGSDAVAWEPILPWDVSGAEMAASRTSEGESGYAAAWERYLAAQTPEALGDIGGTWARFWDTQAVEAVGAYLIPMDLGDADLAASRDAVAWELILPWEVRGAASAESDAVAWEPILPWDVSGAQMAASRTSEGENGYAAAWQRYLAAQTPEALGDIGGTWARFWDTQAVEAVGVYLIPMDLDGADLAASSGFAAANRYAAAWQNFLATQNPQSMDLGNMGETWALFWANVETGGIVETDDSFEVVCCR